MRRGNSTIDSEKKIVKIEMQKSKFILIIILSTFFYLAAIVLWHQEKIDTEIILMHNVLFSHDYYMPIMKIISRYGMGLIAFLLAILLLLFRSKDRNKDDQPLFFYILITFSFASITGDLLKVVIERARPVLELSSQIIQTEISSSSSFPSGHATKSMALALSLFVLGSNKNRTKIIFKILTLCIALFVCYSRVALQKHYVSDILAGIGTALFFTVITVYAVNFFFKRMNVDENKDVPMKYGIMSIPTLLIFKNGEVVDKLVGAVPKIAAFGSTLMSLPPR